MAVRPTAAPGLVGERHVGQRHQRLAAEDAGEVLPGGRATGRGDRLGRALGDDPAAAVAALRPEVDDPVGGLDDVEVVLDDDDRVAAVDEAVEDLEQLLDVGEVQAGGRLVEDVQRPPRRPSRQLGRELDPLRLAAGEGRRRLAEVDVAEADVEQGLELGADLGDRREELERLGDGHLEHVRDGLALVVDLEGLAVVALALADLARDVDVGQELHLDLQDAVALAVLAASALDVEAEAARACSPGRATRARPRTAPGSS